VQLNFRKSAHGRPMVDLHRRASWSADNALKAVFRITYRKENHLGYSTTKVCISFLMGCGEKKCAPLLPRIFSNWLFLKRNANSHFTAPGEQVDYSLGDLNWCALHAPTR